MLVAMTYNSGLFIALLVGYFIGNYIFYPLSVSLKQNRKKQFHLSGGDDGCH
jgi:flagellar motor component MotA